MSMPLLPRPLLLGAAVLAALLLSACSMSGTPNASTPTTPAPSTASSSPAAPGSTQQPSSVPSESTSANGRLSVTLTAAESQVPFGSATRWAMTYNGSVTGPTLRVRPGDQLSITVVNNLNEATSLHTHGLHVSPEQDNPFVMVEPGQSRTYTYDIPTDQQAGTYWYHPHVHELTAEQVAAGLSGAIVVANDADAALSRVSTDRVLVVNDPPLTTTKPVGSTSGMSGHDMGGMGDMGGMMGDSGSSDVDMMTAMRGRTGPRLLTNGSEGVALAGSGGKLERVHLVNATASTSLVVSFDGARMVALSSSGGRLPAPREVVSVTLGPGERTELVLVPGAAGGTLRAQRLSNEGSGGPVGLPEAIATVSSDAGTDLSALPPLTANTRDLFAPDVAVARQRVVTLDGHMNPTIDGVAFDPHRVNLTAAKGTVEEWVIRSNSPMVHPIHLHTWPFQVNGQQGWTDVVTVPANGEQVIRVAFDDFSGTTVLHCHILDHEDTGMMAVIKVE